MATNKKLGKGLSSLLGNKEDLPINIKDDKGLLLVSIEKIFRDENQPRKEFDPMKINELAQSIKKNGLIQPLIFLIISPANAPAFPIAKTSFPGP